MFAEVPAYYWYKSPYQMDFTTPPPIKNKSPEDLTDKEKIDILCEINKLMLEALKDTNDINRRDLRIILSSISNVVESDGVRTTNLASTLRSLGIYLQLN